MEEDRKLSCELSCILCIIMLSFYTRLLLLFADDTSLVASDKEGLEKSLDVWLSGVKSGG